MGKIGRSQLAAMNMVYNRYSFTYFLDSLERMGVGQFELWAGAPPFLPFHPKPQRCGKTQERGGIKGA